MRSSKVFCIGFSKTGTSSLHQAFEVLGLRSCHHFHKGKKAKPLINRAKEEGKPLMHYIDAYDVYSDLGLHDDFKILDTQYSGSVFILSDRKVDDWIKSKLKHDAAWNQRNPDKKPRDISPKRAENLQNKRSLIYDDIFKYFDGRDDFLVVNVCDGEGWENICRFLELPIPSVPFPHANKGSSGLGLRSFFGRLLRAGK